MLECELHATFRRHVTCNVWNASYMLCFDGELHANVGMRVTCHISRARYMQRLECEFHAMFRWRGTCNFWNASYMPRFDATPGRQLGPAANASCLMASWHYSSRRHHYCIVLDRIDRCALPRHGNVQECLGPCVQRLLLLLGPARYRIHNICSRSIGGRVPLVPRLGSYFCQKLRPWSGAPMEVEVAPPQDQAYHQNGH